MSSGKKRSVKIHSSNKIPILKPEEIEKLVFFSLSRICIISDRAYLSWISVTNLKELDLTKCIFEIISAHQS